MEVGGRKKKVRKLIIIKLAKALSLQNMEYQCLQVEIGKEYRRNLNILR